MATSSPSDLLGTTKFKFSPPIWPDTMPKDGVTISVSARCQCITAMKEYEYKSVEELRLEDYTLKEKANANNVSPADATLPKEGFFASNSSITFAVSNSNLFESSNSTTTSSASTFKLSNPAKISTVLNTENTFSFSNPFNKLTLRPHLNPTPSKFKFSEFPGIKRTASSPFALSNLTTTATFTFSNPSTTAFTFSNPTATTFTFSNPTTTTFTFSKFPDIKRTASSPFALSNPTTTATFTFSNPSTTEFTFSNPKTTTFTFSNPASTFPNANTTPNKFHFGAAETCDIFQNVRKVKSRSTKYEATLGKNMGQLELNTNTAQNSDTPLFIEESTQTEEEISVNKLLQGLKEILLNSKHSDFILNVKGLEFRVHKIILEAQSPVFAAMLGHDTKEKADGIANIDDCEPLTMTKFLNFLYTGRVENLNSDNVLDLYEVADKYQVTELSNLCIKYMKNNISTENFCDVLGLSLRHHVRELTEVATDFFLQNSTEIAITAKWGTFLDQNPVAGNELFLKALNLKKE